MYKLSKGVLFLTENLVTISICCSKCGTVNYFEILIDREDGFDSNLECNKCGWSLAKLDIQKNNIVVGQ